jgi:hypothetical protein
MPRTAVASLVAGLLELAACAEATHPGTAFTAEERAALITAIELDHESVQAWTLRTVVGLAFEIGQIAPYDAIGSQVLVTFWDGTSPSWYGFTRIDGWTDFNAGAATVGSSLLVQSNYFEAALPASISTTVQPGFPSGEMYALYTAESTRYGATDGELELSMSGFGGLEDCPGVPPWDPTFLELIRCRYSFGTMAGNFRFNAVSSIGGAFSQPSTLFELPAVRLDIEMRRSEPAKQTPTLSPGP